MTKNNVLKISKPTDLEKAKEFINANEHPRLQKVSIIFEKELHTELKTWASSHGRQIKDVVTEAVKEFLKLNS